MNFAAERAGLTIAGALVFYAALAGAISVAQRSARLRDRRVQRWNAVFYGGGSAAPAALARTVKAQRAA